MTSTVLDMSKVSERKEVATVSDSTALMQVIERAARDPSVDIERMERLLAMHERMMAQQAKAAYAAAMARLQPKLPIIEERGSILNKAGEVQSKYALWEDIVGVITPLLASEGFSLSFRTGNKEQRIQVTGILMHERGHSEETELDLPADISGNKNAVQAVASSVSYGKRYTAGALLNLRMGALDDDGQSAASVKLLSPEQIAAVRQHMKDVGTNEGQFLEYWHIQSLEEMPACNLFVIKEMLDRKGKKVDPRGDLSGVDVTLRDKRVSEITDLVNEYGADENLLAEKLQQYHAEYLNPFPELWIAISDKLARDGVVKKGAMSKLLNMGKSRDTEKRW